MDFLRVHWYQIGTVIAVAFCAFLLAFYDSFSSLRILLSISFITLLLHQFEEYWWPGYFPRMLNTVVFKSDRPDRYPLNTNTTLIINVGIGWIGYILAIVFAEHAIWLGIAAILVSAGNFIAHTFVFNIKGKTFYNPGMVTSIVLFLSITIYFFIFLAQHDLLHKGSLILGIVLGILINASILGLVSILGNKNTRYIFQPFH